MPKQKIIITRDVAAKCYTARRVNDAETMELFGTDTLPTPFTLNARIEMVLAEIVRLNPDCDVVVEDAPASRRVYGARNSFGTYGGCEKHNRVNCVRCETAHCCDDDCRSNGCKARFDD